MTTTFNTTNASIMNNAVPLPNNGTVEEMWTSKLGHRYPKAEIEARHKQTMVELNHLRFEGTNATCADCGTTGGRTIWSSVNLGVFLCLRCGSLHRALGTHISKPKGCSGTYLWGPDELDNMHLIGNARAQEIYGGVEQRPPSDASDAIWLKYLQEKYVQKKFAPKTASQAATTSTGAHHHEAKEAEKSEVAACFQDLLNNYHPVPTQTSPSQFPGSSHRDETHPAKGSSPRVGSSDFFAQFGV